jgi:hypothetical protein
MKAFDKIPDSYKINYENLKNDALKALVNSHKTSCYYGAGTKWCTTNKESDHYFKKYTSNGTLIYVINKKQPESNIWHKAAFFIDNDGDVSVFDAPDKPHIVIEASKNLANWDIIRDTIIEYLYTNNLKGIDRFYVGQDLVTWYESKGVDIFKELSSEELINKVGLTAVQNLLKKRGVSIFEYFNFNRLLQLFLNDPESGLTSEQATKKIWEGEIVKSFSLEIQETARRKLRMLHNSQDLQDLMIPPSNRLEKLKGNLKLDNEGIDQHQVAQGHATLNHALGGPPQHGNQSHCNDQLLPRVEQAQAGLRL